MYIEGRWYTEPELAAYIKELKARINTLETENEKLRNVIKQSSEEEWD